MAKKKVILETKGLDKFQKSLGKNGIRFTTGLFDSTNATHGAILEYGNENQVARPWMSSAFYPNSETRNDIVKKLGKLVKGALEGVDLKKKTAVDITISLQEHLLDQKFSAKKLKKVTVDKKKRKLSVTPDHIGLDTYEMVSSIKTKIGKRS